MAYAEIVVNVPIAPILPRKEAGPGELSTVPYSWLDQTFTYNIPAELKELIAPGQMVWVPFGARRQQGIVFSLSETTSLDETRPIQEIVDPRPLLSPVQIDLARWIAHRYLAPLSECIWMMLPPGIEEKVEAIYELAPEAKAEIDLTDPQRKVLELVKIGHAIKSTRVPVNLRGTAESLVRSGHLSKTLHIRPSRAKPKRIKTVRLLSDSVQETRETEPHPSTEPRKSSKVIDRLSKVTDFLRGEGGSAWISAVYAETGASANDLRRLERTGIVRLESEEAFRDPLGDQEFITQSPFPLTGEQTLAFREIRIGLESQNPCNYLLHGVTGSGKTEIYLNAIEDVLRQGKRAIALVPEIALTPQAIRRFGARFGSAIGVVHSELSYGERYDTWRRARDGKIEVIIGPRSALFVPLPNLGLIVIDEEHEPSYKQEALGGAQRYPLYHTREVALELARLSGASVLMGSATPDVETYFRARGGEFKLVELPQRILAHSTAEAPVQYQDLPPVQVIDLRAELKVGNTSIFSRPLSKAIAETLAAKEQVILFLNRRGTASCVLCRTCGQSVKCPRCNNPYTLHQFGAQATSELVCHHCGKRGKVPRSCPNCGSTRVRPLGLGTEKLEQLVRETWPMATTLRWDRDAARGKGSHEKILESFTMGEADVLIGTQMIAKGLDLPRVTCVGVMNADTSLNLPDFRSSERTFQLLTQVAGRAGRGALGGRVFIQTYFPEHYAIAAAAKHDYEAFYKREIQFRGQTAYPPFRPLVRIVFTGAKEEDARLASTRLAAALMDRIRRQGLPDVEMIGPAPAFFAKWAGKFRYHVILLGNNARMLLSDFPLPAGWRVDVDPLNLL